MTDHSPGADYLAGETDGLDLDPNERATLDRVRHHLKTDALWEQPASDGQFRLLAAAAAEAAENAAPPPVRSVPPVTVVPSPSPVRVEPVEREADEPVSLDAHRSKRGRAKWFGGGVLAAAAALALAFVTADQLGTDDPPEQAAVLTYDLAPTELDPDTEAVLDVKSTVAGVEFWLRLKGLDNTDGADYYSAWLISDTEAIPVGSFHWRMGGVPIVLWSGVDDPSYDQFVVTRQVQGDGGFRSEDVVLIGDVPSFDAEAGVDSDG